jgi:hypothetical protein
MDEGKIKQLCNHLANFYRYLKFLYYFRICEVLESFDEMWIKKLRTGLFWAYKSVPWLVSKTFVRYVFIS